jgi:hypothetical protein
VQAVAFVPSAPFLLLDDGPPGLRSAIDEALAALLGDVVVVGAAPTPGWVEGEADLSAYGVPVEPPARPLPLSLSVGTTLLGDRPHRLWGLPAADLPAADCLVVVGDGSAKRTEKAPGHLDLRAEAFDRSVERALADGDPESLAALDAALAAELWASGVTAWRAVLRLAPGPWRGRVLYADAPYGVGYVVATWERPA